MGAATSGQRTQVDQEIHIYNASDLAFSRSKLITDTWGGSAPGEVGTLNTITSPVPGLTNLDTTQDITMTTYPAKRPVVWTPLTPANKLLILHQGHSNGFNGLDMNLVIQEALTNNITVCGMVMPGGSDPYTSGTSVDHDNDQDPLEDFIGPVWIVINTLIGTYGNEIYMNGLSGGGWTTTVAAAADDRIKKSFPQAGSLPEYMAVFSAGGFRDWEQKLQESFNLSATYLDCYIMAGSLWQKQILYELDDC